jgi:CheY-like chemotaxis protein
MSGGGIGRLRTVVFVAPEKLRAGITGALTAQGFKDVREAGTTEEFLEHARFNDLDVVITLGAGEETAVSNLIRDLRLGLLDTSPFPIILALLPTANKDDVFATIDSGVDDVLLFPVSTDALVKRILQFTQDRRPFVVTHDYVGPDRRVNPRADQPGSLLVKVPNPVRSRCVGVPDQDIRHGIEDAIIVINRDKLKLNGLHLLRLLAEFCGDDEHPPAGVMTPSDFVVSCIKSCDDTARRARASSERNIRERAAAAAMTLRSFMTMPDPTTDPRFASLFRSIEGVVNEISAYHGVELKL